jgi:hypothetical protein
MPVSPSTRPFDSVGGLGRRALTRLIRGVCLGIGTCALLTAAGQAGVPKPERGNSVSGPSSSVSARATVTGSITIDGPSLQVTIPAGDNAAISFAGTAGQKLGLGLSSVTGPTRTVTIQNGNTILADGGVSSSGGELDVTLPVTTSYTIILSAVSTASGSVTLTLSTDLTVSLPLDGDSPQVATTRPGQNARLTFTGAVGDHLGLAVSQKSGGSFVLTLLKPTGYIVMGSTTTPIVNEFDLDLLEDGGYTIFIDPTGPATAAATFTLSRDVQGRDRRRLRLCSDHDQPSRPKRQPQLFRECG